MSKSHRAFATIFLMIFIASATLPIAFNSQPVTTVSLVDAQHAPAATNYVVTVGVYNELQAFNDDDFKFTVYNGTNPLGEAWIRLYNASTMVLLEAEQTDGNGEFWFHNLAQGTYLWNVSHTGDSITPAEIGQIVSDGPEADVSILFGNLDWENDEDDLNVTIIDIENNPANNLNFSIHNSTDDSIWAQTEVIDGEADFQDLPDGNYEWKLQVMGGITYDGYILDSGTIEANSTQTLVDSWIGPLTGLPEYYDLQLFTFYETSFQPIIGAEVNVTYMNGSAYSVKTTPANGTVIFTDLPAEFMNWSVTHLGLPIGLGDYYFNLSAPSADLQAPVVTSPGNQDILVDSENVTISWHLEDPYPSSIEVYIDNELNQTISWMNTTYDYVFNVSAVFGELVIGEYEIKLIAYDWNLNENSTTITLRIYEDVFPVIEGPDDLEFYFCVAGQSISWNVSDDNVNMYTVMDNDDVFTSGDINPDEPVITIILDGLAIGEHNFTLQANDTSGNDAEDLVVVTVKADDIAPVIVFTPDTVTYSQGETNIIRNWTATDDFMDYYTITVDGIEVIHADWVTENIEFDFAGLLVGTYDVVLTVVDLGGNSVQSTVTIIVSQSPIVTYLIVIAMGSIGVIAFIAIIWFVRYR